MWVMDVSICKSIISNNAYVWKIIFRALNKIPRILQVSPTFLGFQDFEQPWFWAKLFYNFVLSWNF